MMGLELIVSSLLCQIISDLLLWCSYLCPLWPQHQLYQHWLLWDLSFLLALPSQYVPYMSGFFYWLFHQCIDIIFHYIYTYCMLRFFWAPFSFKFLILYIYIYIYIYILYIYIKYIFIKFSIWRITYCHDNLSGVFPFFDTWKSFCRLFFSSTHDTLLAVFCLYNVLLLIFPM